MPALVLVAQRLHLIDDVLCGHPAVLVEVALTVIAERAAAPVAAARRQIGNDPLRHEVVIEREAVEVRQRQLGHLLGMDVLVLMQAGRIAVDEVRDGGHLALAVQGLDQPQERMFAFIEDRRIENFRERTVPASATLPVTA